MIILDLGGGGVHHNDVGRIKETVDSIVDINRARDVIIKFQLHPQWGPKEAMRPDVFEAAYQYATGLKFEVTASVFSYSEYEFITGYKVPFIKWANQDYIRRVFNQLICEKDIISVKNCQMFDDVKQYFSNLMCCISKYPATYEDYIRTFDKPQLEKGISDHTGQLDLYADYKPEIYEAHYMLPQYDDRKREYVLGPKDLKALEDLRGDE